MGIKPDDSAIATLIVQYGQAKQLEQAQELFKSASAFFPEGANVYNAMVDAFCKCGKTEDAYHLFMEMAKGSNRDAVTVSILVTHLTKHGKGFFFLYICTCSIALFSCSISHIKWPWLLPPPGKFQEVENIIHGCFQDEVQLDTVLHNTFIKSMLESGLANIFSYSSDRQAKFLVAGHHS